MDSQLNAKMIGRYVIEAKLEQGGMAEVYRAYDPQFKRQVAIKVLPAYLIEMDPTFTARFRREAETIASLEHPAIVPVYDFGETEGRPYLVMRLMTGGSLKERLEKGRMSLREASELLSRLAPGIDKAHAKGIIHRDIKPGNILFDEEGYPYLADFGIVKLRESASTLTGTAATIGTPAYMSPEQGLGKSDIDGRSDIYSLGAILYQMLTAKLPFNADTPTGQIMCHINQPVPDIRDVLPGTSELLQELIARVMAKKPEDRYSTVGELTKALERVLASQETVQKPVKTSAPESFETVAAVSTPVQPLPSPQTVIAPADSHQGLSFENMAPPQRKRGSGLKTGIILGIVAALLLVCALGGTGVYALVRSMMAAQPPNTQVAENPVIVEAATATSAVSIELQPTEAVIIPATNTPLPPKPDIKVGLVTDVGGVNDKSFNQSAWDGVRKAAMEYHFEANYIESKQPTDYEKNIDQLATEGYDVIITVGFLMGDATAVKARQYPEIQFAIIDNAYYPTQGSIACGGEFRNCYSDGGLTNVTSLMFQEDEVGFLAGVLAGGMTQTGTVCSVSGMEIPPVVRYVTGYQSGALWINPDVTALNVYIPSFTDPARGKEVGTSMIGQGCDVIFAVGGNTGNGGLLAASENDLMGIGVDVDQYLTYPEVQNSLISSAMKNVDVAVYEYLKSIIDGTNEAGIITANLANGGVGLAPFHDWESLIPDEVVGKIKEAIDGLISGSISTGYEP